MTHMTPDLVTIPYLCEGKLYPASVRLKLYSPTALWPMEAEARDAGQRAGKQPAPNPKGVIAASLLPTRPIEGDKYRQKFLSCFDVGN